MAGTGGGDGRGIATGGGDDAREQIGRRGDVEMVALEELRSARTDRGEVRR